MEGQEALVRQAPVHGADAFGRAEAVVGDHVARRVRPAVRNQPPDGTVQGAEEVAHAGPEAFVLGLRLLRAVAPEPVLQAVQFAEDDHEEVRIEALHQAGGGPLRPPLRLRDDPEAPARCLPRERRLDEVQPLPGKFPVERLRKGRPLPAARREHARDQKAVERLSGKRNRHAQRTNAQAVRPGHVPDARH